MAMGKGKASASAVDSRQALGRILIAPLSVGTASTVELRPVARCWPELLFVFALADAATSP